MSFSEQRTESTVVELCRDLRKLEQEVSELQEQAVRSLKKGEPG